MGSRGQSGGGTRSSSGRKSKRGTIIKIDTTTGRDLAPAYLNYGESKGNSIPDVLKRFQDRYGDAKKEFGVSVDDQGYVHDHKEGATHSVAVPLRKGHTVIHNHPSGSNFSGQDLLVWANTDIKGIVATSSNQDIKGTFQISKGAHFDKKGFLAALGKADWSKSGDNYNVGADKWLKRNQKKFGYTYKSKGINQASKDQKYVGNTGF